MTDEPTSAPEGAPPVRVYLDQMHWIGLMRARAGDPEGAPYGDLLRRINLLRAAGRIELPLSAGHVFETWKARSAKRRHPLALTMAELSGHASIAPPWILVPAEVAQQLSLRFPQVAVPHVEVFGRGMGHRMGAHDTDYELHGELERVGLGRATAFDAAETILLGGPGEDLPFGPIGQPPLDLADDFATREQQFTNNLHASGVSATQRHDAVMFTAVRDLIWPINEVVARTDGLSWEDVLSLGKEGLTDLVQSIPSWAAVLALRLRAHRSRDTKWHANDLNDLAYTSVAIAHCDIVGGERRWAANLNAAGVAGRFGHTIVHRPAELDAALSAITA